jgi:hypothetical protein
MNSVKWKRIILSSVSVVGLSVPLMFSSVEASPAVVTHAPRLPANAKTATHFNYGWSSRSVSE